MQCAALRARIMHITRVLALLVVARARRRCSEYSMAMPWCGPRPLRNGTADAMRALAASHAWPGVEPGAIRVANVAAPGSNAEVGVATAPDGTRVAVRVGATSNRCRDWAACDAVERRAAAAGCAPNCVEIKILRRVRAESSRRPPRHRRDACSMAWRCRFLAARPSQDGRVIAEK